jgi:hypothetical protein
MQPCGNPRQQLVHHQSETIVFYRECPVFDDVKQFIGCVGKYGSLFVEKKGEKKHKEIRNESREIYLPEHFQLNVKSFKG